MYYFVQKTILSEVQFICPPFNLSILREINLLGMKANFYYQIKNLKSITNVRKQFVLDDFVKKKLLNSVK